MPVAQLTLQPHLPPTHPPTLPALLQFCRLNQPPESFPITMRPIWTISPSYYHYKGCTCMGSFKPSYITK